MIKKILFAALSASLLATTAAAHETGARLSEACRTEIRALCGSAAGREARHACMKENRNKVSEGCRAELKARMQARRAARGDNLPARGNEPKPIE